MLKILSSDLLKNQNQVILVCAKDTKAMVYLCEKVNNKWITVMQTEGFIGKNGIGKEKEGDMKTPIGLYDIGIAFGLEDNVKTKLDYYKLDTGMYWICDSNSKYYNQFVNSTIVDKDWEDSKNEHLIEENIAYEYAIEIKYNKEKVPQKGSAIFLHCIKNGPTAGCVSISKGSMKFILQNINKDTKIYIQNVEEYTSKI